MWDDRFDTPDYVYGKAPAAFLTDHAGWLTPGARGLAVADGEGRNSTFMAQRGLSVTAMDSSPNAIAKARALAAERGVRVDHVEASITDWDWAPAAFDVVAAIFIQFLRPAERAAVFAGMARTLAPGGTLLLHGYTPEQIAFGTGGPRNPDFLYTEALLRGQFAGLEIVELRSYEREISEGVGHSGRSALIDMVAKKPA
ncbi:SAM-dependent methyltransferase [Sinisalibacter aestuarii]|uniref:SAM-dependent methyltransferase n=2 Tax=Sinisalibacter aestuarii TaxID=2949426 RepID=A0ABQ5LZ25_9RHOB|nr:SAM-dependent methyltransferase [Sinisalibacter aestuarii]